MKNKTSLQNAQLSKYNLKRLKFNASSHDKISHFATRIEAMRSFATCEALRSLRPTASTYYYVVETPRSRSCTVQPPQHYPLT